VHALDTTPGDTDDHSTLLGTLFDFLREQRAPMLRWPTLPTDTPFFAVLTDWLEENGLAHSMTKRVQRPLLVADAPDGAAALAERLGGKRVREFRRCRRRLEELGAVELRTIDGPHAASLWLADFLEIERSGWKGERGTAIACDAAERAWFEAVATRAAVEGRLLVYALDVAGRTAAMSVNFRSDRRIWCFKTAYRDELARHAPGALLEYESTLAALADPSIAWLDACSADDSGLMGALWDGRRPVVDMLIATRRGSNRLTRTVATGWRAYLAAKRRGAAFVHKRKQRGQGRP
jgi:hypothetical protein